MNEESLNNTVSACGNQHIGGFILLERVDRHRWRAYGWSAFFVRMMLSADNCESFQDKGGHPICELSKYNVMVLNDRLETKGKQTDDRMVFVVPASLVIAESVYLRWKKNLPAETKPECRDI